MIAEFRIFFCELTALATELRMYLTALRLQAAGPTFGPKPEDVQKSFEEGTSEAAETAKLFGDLSAVDPFGTDSGFVDLETAVKNHDEAVKQQFLEATQAIESYTFTVEALTAKGAVVSEDGCTVSWSDGNKYPRPAPVKPL